MIRKELAEEQNIPPFVIFSDATLMDMCIKYPQNETEFLTVKGVGENKLTKYGPIFIQAIRDYVNKHSIKVEPKQSDAEIDNQSIKDTKKPSKLLTYDLYTLGHTIDDIVQLRGMSKITIENHLLACFKDGLDYQLEVDEAIEHQILKVCEAVGTGMLKPIKEQLPEEVTYSEIKYVMIKHHL
jgi:ATP-dependent DNA helicase RecQ